MCDEMNLKCLVITTADGPEGIHAYNVDTNKLEWKKEMEGMKKAGIVSVGHGHLFICDWDNKCIHMLSVSEGHYLGYLVKRGDQGLGSPSRAAWSEEKSSLIIAHTKNWKWYISIIKVQ